MTDEQIQANSDRAHADSVANTEAINAQTAQMAAMVAMNQKMLDAYNAPQPEPVTRLSFADMQALTGVLAELLKSTKA